jgi:hypothetical protein
MAVPGEKPMAIDTAGLSSWPWDRIVPPMANKSTIRGSAEPVRTVCQRLVALASGCRDPPPARCQDRGRA